jgi:hypothetical protein
MNPSRKLAILGEEFDQLSAKVASTQKLRWLHPESI